MAWISGRQPKSTAWRTTIRGEFMADAIDIFLSNVASQLNSKQVKVGFISGRNYVDSGVSVAMVAAINEYGNPANNQPPRPFFRNAIAGHSEEWADAVARAIRSGTPTDTLLELVGAQIWGDVNQSITTLIEPALSPVTIALRRVRGNKSTKPLVDTKTMLGDLSYEVGEIEPSE